jgi:hypothetical protein
MEAPRIKRLGWELKQGPGHPDKQDRIIVKGKVFNSETGQLRSPVEIALQQLKKTAEQVPHAVIQAVIAPVFE